MPRPLHPQVKALEAAQAAKAKEVAKAEQRAQARAAATERQTGRQALVDAVRTANANAGRPPTAAPTPAKSQAPPAPEPSASVGVGAAAAGAAAEGQEATGPLARTASVSTMATGAAGARQEDSMRTGAAAGVPVLLFRVRHTRSCFVGASASAGRSAAVPASQNTRAKPVELPVPASCIIACDFSRPWLCANVLQCPFVAVGKNCPCCQLPGCHRCTSDPFCPLRADTASTAAATAAPPAAASGSAAPSTLPGSVRAKAAFFQEQAKRAAADAAAARKVAQGAAAGSSGAITAAAAGRPVGARWGPAWWRLGFGMACSARYCCVNGLPGSRINGTLASMLRGWGWLRVGKPLPVCPGGCVGRQGTQEEYAVQIMGS